MEQDYMRFKARLEIDALRLDDDLMELPLMQNDVAEAVAVAIMERDDAKFTYDQALADVAASLREATPGISEARIKSESVLYDEVQTAHRRVLETEYAYNRWRGLADSYRTKSKSLEIVGDLINSGYLTPDAIRNRQRALIHDYRKQYHQQPSSGGATDG